MRTNDTLRNGCLSLLLILVILVIDQLIKIEVKTHFSLGESVRVTNWFYLSFVENNGMAYGMTFFNKIVLSMFRIIALVAIGWYMCQVVRRKHSVGYLVVLSMIFTLHRFTICSLWHGLCFVPAWQGGRHVLLSTHRDDLSRLDALEGWGRVCVLCTGV